MNTSLINLLLQLKNAALVHKESIQVNYNTKFLKILEVLYKESLIQSFKINFIKTKITITFRYFFNLNSLDNLKIFSTPSRQIFLSFESIIKLSDRNKVFFFSTNNGIQTHTECKKANKGGKLLFSI
jgi:ribosomal protein S8